MYLGKLNQVILKQRQKLLTLKEMMGNPTSLLMTRYLMKLGKIEERKRKKIKEEEGERNNIRLYLTCFWR